MDYISKSLEILKEAQKNKKIHFKELGFISHVLNEVIECPKCMGYGYEDTPEKHDCQKCKGLGIVFWQRID